MGYQIKDSTLGTIVAAADLSAKRYYAVALGSGGWGVPSVAGQKVAGILLNDPESGQVAEVQTSEICPAKFGGTIAAGDRLSVTSAGKLKVAEKGDYVIARALVAGVDGDEGTVLVTNEGHAAISRLCLHYNLADIANGDLMTGFTPGYAGKIVKLSAIVTKAASTASKLATLNLEIGTTDLTGGSLALTTVACNTLGAIVNASAITAANTFTATDTISLEAASVTAFVEGEIEIVIELAQL